jgi:hypothetical protein
MLYILCQNSFKYQDTIKTLVEDKLGFFDYEIVDPKFHKIDRTFSTILMLEPLDPKIRVLANKVFKTLAPDTSLSVDEKKKIFLVFKESIQYAIDHTLKKEILQADIPRFADLSEFLHSFKGQVMELKLSDGRIIGIYPDEDKLAQKYVAEYHVSTILNLAKLQDVIGYIKLSVKDL